VHTDGKIAICNNFETTRIPPRKRCREINEDDGQAKPIRGILYALVAGGPGAVTLSGMISTNAVSSSRSLAEVLNDSFKALG
jgi:hypothetical protein